MIKYSPKQLKWIEENQILINSGDFGRIIRKLIKDEDKLDGMSFDDEEELSILLAIVCKAEVWVIRNFEITIKMGEEKHYLYGVIPSKEEDEIFTSGDVGKIKPLVMKYLEERYRLSNDVWEKFLENVIIDRSVIEGE